ncbi:MAG: DeoR/GlpR family DNA-binding transcription regulator [Propylenella sp.]
MARLKKKERQKRILAELRASATIRIPDLASQFGVSTETIRRDLDELGEGGHLNRTYGGAVMRPVGFEPAFSDRFGAMREERERIAGLASDFVQPGEALMIDGGTTVLHFAQHLATAANAKELTVITNSFPVAMALGVNPAVRVISCPGAYDPREGIVAGTDTVAFLERFHANRMITSASGLTIEGPTEINAAAAAVKRAMLRRSADRILLLDHAKFDRPSLEVVCPLGDLDRLVTDMPVPAHFEVPLRDAEVEVVC